MVQLFISHVRPILDYCSTVWNVGYMGDLRLLEAVQRRWTREIEGLGQLEYSERLKEAGLYSVAGRFLRMDLIKVWKAFHCEVDVGLRGIFEVAQYAGTRGHSFKLSIPVCHTEVRRRSLGVRCVSEWNALSPLTVESANVETFKRRLDCELGHELFATLR